MHFNLTINPDLVAPGFVTEERYGGLQGSKVQRPRHSLCYFLGKVSDSDSDVRGSAALSTCDGLVSVLHYIQFRSNLAFLRRMLFDFLDLICTVIHFEL